MKAKDLNGQEVKMEGVVNDLTEQSGVKYTASTAVVGDANSITPPTNGFIWCGANKKRDADKVPPPYGVVHLAICMKSDAEIAELKNNITNGVEAERLAELWNLEPGSSEVETMLSNLSRAIINREIHEKESDCSYSATHTDLPDKTLQSSVENIFANVKNYEEACTKLPTVPSKIDF